MIRIFIVTDLFFGDSGKGKVVDALTRRYDADLIVRFNGGAQCAHNVVDADGRHHTFHQFGSGTLASEHASTALSKYVLVDPLNLLVEASYLSDLGVAHPLTRIYVDETCLLVTPYHKALNRLRERARADKRHGSCGMGIGETVSDSIRFPEGALRVRDIAQADFRSKLEEKRKSLLAEAEACGLLDTSLMRSSNATLLRRLLTEPVKPDVCEQFEHFSRSVNIVDETGIQWLVACASTVIFEGGQGVLLDECLGFHPYTTWSRTTSHNADLFISGVRANTKEIFRLGVMRTYGTRHGAGPFPTENCNLYDMVNEKHNTTNPWQRQFRVGHLDLPLLRYALMANPVDGLCLTHCEIAGLTPKLEVCAAYENMELNNLPTCMAEQTRLAAMLSNAKCQLKNPGTSLRPMLTDELSTPIWMESFGPTAQETIYHEKLAEAYEPATAIS